MLKETKTALRVSVAAYDVEIVGLIQAAAADLGIAGVFVPGISFNITYADGVGTVTDNCSILDPLLIRAIITYVRANFGSPADYERLKASYDEQKAQLQTATGYGLG